MSTQKHIIKRQVIELQIQHAADAQLLQAEVSRIYRQRIVPLVDKYCSALSQPDRLYQIDSLELDLGVIDPQHLEEDFVARLNEALPPALARQIKAQEQAANGQGQNAKIKSQLELLAVFARTGSLPWWADATQPQLLDDCLHYLLEAVPEQLRRLLLELVQEQPVLQRLISHYDEGLLSRLSGLAAPLLRETNPQELLLILPKTRVGAGRPAAQLRRIVWINVLGLAGLAGEPFLTVALFYQAVLTRVAVALGITYSSLISEMQPVLSADRERNDGDLTQTLETLGREHSGGSQDLAARPTSKERTLAAVLRSLALQLPPPLQQELLVALKAMGSDLALDAAASPAEFQRLLELLQLGLARYNLSPTLIREMVAELRSKLAADGLAVAELSELIQAIQQNLEAQIVSPTVAAGSPVDLSFSQADELYLGNAGLVILWPFLGRFFERLDLLAAQRFKDTAAQQRAVGLLQFLVSGEHSFPEYLLPLNKVLCGMELAETFDFDPLLAEAEAEEGENLLVAVIAQAPILRDMSVAGFRGTFLLRQGMLSTRDGAWLLRVERETYDIVLDRFPWSWEWLKLPWMAAPLRVEW